jgi:hypothetical protein
VPIFVGMVLRFGRTNDNPLLAADSIAALVLSGAIAGIPGTLCSVTQAGAGTTRRSTSPPARTAGVTSSTRVTPGPFPFFV